MCLGDLLGGLAVDDDLPHHLHPLAVSHITEILDGPPPRGCGLSTFFCARKVRIYDPSGLVEPSDILCCFGDHTLREVGSFFRTITFDLPNDLRSCILYLQCEREELLSGESRALEA